MIPAPERPGKVGSRFDPSAKARAEISREIFAGPRLAQADRPAAAGLTPLLHGPGAHGVWVAAAF